MKSNKNTDTVQDIEKRMQAELLIIKDPNSTVDQKKEAIKKAGYLEDFMNTVNYKQFNGKVYPDRTDTILKSDKPMNKEEIIELMDSVNIPYDKQHEETKMDMELRGIFLPDSLKD